MAILTAAGIGAAIVGALGVFKDIASGAVKVIVIVASISFALIFSAAVLALLNMLTNVAAQSVVGEVFGVISMCLPFNMMFIWSEFILIIDGILLFLVAKKTWELISNVMEFAV